jgi:hypothetical protein
MFLHERQAIRDLLAAAQRVGGSELKQKVWELLPYNTRLDFNYGQESATSQD